MKLAARIFFIFGISLLTVPAFGHINWGNPEVVPERLVRKERRVIRFSGLTEPGTLIRVRKNRIKMYKDNYEPRLALIPQKTRVQFPVQANGAGEFSFDIYLPTWAVEIPIEYKLPQKNWRPYTLTFRVPERGEADNLQAIQESFRAQDARMEKVRLDRGFYSRKADQGLRLKSRDRKQEVNVHGYEVWGGLGFSYMHTDVSIPNFNGATSDGALVLPTFRVGGTWNPTQKWSARVSLRSTSGRMEDIGNSDTTGNSFSWFEGQAHGIYFAEGLQPKWGGRLGLDFGVQLQTLPLFRRRADETQFLEQTAFFSNSVYSVHIGAHYEGDINKEWGFEAYARYLYPFASGGDFSVSSVLPLQFEFGGGVRRPLTKGMDLGIFGQWHQIFMETEYAPSSGGAVSADLSLSLFTVDVRLIGHF